MPFAPTPRPCTIPDGTHVLFHLMEPASSNESRTGESFQFALIAPIKTGTCTISPDGATGSGTIYLAGASGSQGHEGDLTLRIDTLRTTDGHYVNFDDQRIGINGKNRKIESAALGFTPFVGLAAMFIRGSDIKIDANTPIETVLLHPASFTDSPAPVPPRFSSPAATPAPAQTAQASASPR